MSEVDDFRSRAASVEYWFWKFRSGELAFLVDFIVRKPEQAAEVRVSLWARGKGRVIHDTQRTWEITPSRVSIGGHELGRAGSRGSIESVSWDLSWDPGEALVDPLPPLFGRLHAIDLELFIRPEARFRGSVMVDGETFVVEDVPGMLEHYWGRRLPDRWWWISATEFEGAPGMRVEAGIATSSFWGKGRMPINVGYLWVGDGVRTDLTISPATGLVLAKGGAENLTIDAIGLRGRRHRVRVRAPEDSFNDLGEGILQTLLAELECDGRRAVAGTVGFERRGGLTG